MTDKNKAARETVLLSDAIEQIGNYWPDSRVKHLIINLLLDFAHDITNAKREGRSALARELLEWAQEQINKHTWSDYVVEEVLLELRKKLEGEK